MLFYYMNREDDNVMQPVGSMPDVCRYGINQLITKLHLLVEKGLKSILIFGIVSNLPKVSNIIEETQKNKVSYNFK